MGRLDNRPRLTYSCCAKCGRGEDFGVANRHSVIEIRRLLLLPWIVALRKLESEPTCAIWRPSRHIPERRRGLRAT